MLENISLEFDRKRLKIREFTINTVLNKSLTTSTLPLIEVWAAEITNKRGIPQLLSVLPQLPSKLAHLKRIKGQLVLFADASDCIVVAGLKQKITDVTGIDKFVTVQVPAVRPRTSAQFVETKKYWPSGFHEDKILEKKLKNTFFDEVDSKRYGDLFMRVEEVDGGLIYNPQSKHIVVDVMGVLSGHLLQHPVMRLIDALSNLQLSETKNVDADIQYLANGFDVILSSEPCTMCAMALAHARVGRVFFGRTNLCKGALVSRWRLQEEPSINHHYEVFQIVEK